MTQISLKYEFILHQLPYLIGSDTDKSFKNTYKEKAYKGKVCTKRSKVKNVLLYFDGRKALYTVVAFFPGHHLQLRITFTPFEQFLEENGQEYNLAKNIQQL